VKLWASCEDGGTDRDQLLTTLASNASQKGTYYYTLTLSGGKVQRIQERLAINAC
jgi:ferritin-like protein